MSAIVITWVNKDKGYEHTALLLNNLESNQSLYISVYLSKENKNYRFASQSFEQDKKNHTLVSYVVIPTVEDGNKFGLFEGGMAVYWNEIFAFKKTDHQRFIKEISVTNERSVAADPPEEEKNPQTSALVGAQNALVDLSEEFKQFASHQFFIPTTVDCTKFVAKVLRKGGLDLFLNETDRQSLEGYIGVSEIREIAKQAVIGIVEMQNEKTRRKDPDWKTSEAATWADRRSFRY